MKCVLCVGNIVMDVLTRAVDEITWGGTRWVDSIVPSLGGNGANTSATLAMLGVPVKMIGAVGEDTFGDSALARLRECGVDLSLVQRMPQGTAASVALVRSDGTRAFLHRPGVSRELFAEPFDLTKAAQGCWRFHLGNPFSLSHLRKQAPRLFRQARDLGLS
ncbi:MAG: carbohydrate kinase family protein, partial [Candidatus Solibacter usitatus]|nr:carbohydrate kinase family protein [Candidatus Solibacter usitatus]